MSNHVLDFEKEIDWQRLNAEVEKIVLGKLGNDAGDQLAIDGTKLEKLTQTCPDLTHLYLWNLDGLKKLPELPAKLKCLDVRGCKELQTVPELPKTMETLDLGDCNAIQDLKDKDFSGFKSLTRVYLNGCTSLKSFVPFLAVAPQLKELTVEGCHFDGLPGALCRPGNMAGDVQTWLAEQDEERQGVTLINTVKVLLIGNGRVGKTTLARRLQGLAPNKEEPSTHAIHFWSLKWNDFRPKGAETDETLTLNLWDFGGQDLYHNTHRIFFQGASIFLVLWSVSPPVLKEGEQEENHPRSLSYWLDQVLSVNPQATIVLVRGRADVDQGKATWKDHVEERHLSLLNVIDAGDFNGFGVEGSDLFVSQRNSIRESVKMAAAKVLGGIETRSHPKGWARISDVMVNIQAKNSKAEELGKPLRNTIWSYDLFNRVLAKTSINRDGTPSQDLTNPEPLMDWLNAAGYLFRDKHRFGNRLIVDQRWAIDGIYTILKRGTRGSEQLREHRGTFFPKDLSLWEWNSRGYSETEQQLMLAFMESCKTIVKIIDGSESTWDSDVYLCLEFLPKKSPAFFKDAPTWSSEEIGNDKLGSDRISALLVELARHAKNHIDLWRWGAKIDDLSAGGTIWIEWKPLEKDRFGGKLAVEYRGRNPEQSEVLEWTIELADNVLNGVGLSFGAIRPAFKDRRYPPRSWGDTDRLEPRLQHFRTQGEAPWMPPISTVGISMAGNPTPGASFRPPWDLTAAPLALYERLKREEQKGFRVTQYLDSEDGLASARAFIKRLIRGDIVIVFLSDRYFRSPYCMGELFDLAIKLSNGSSDVVAWDAESWSTAKVLVFALPDAVRASRDLDWQKDIKDAWWKSSQDHLLGIANRQFGRDLMKALSSIAKESKKEYGINHEWLWFIHNEDTQQKVTHWLSDFRKAREEPDVATLSDPEKLSKWADEKSSEIVERTLKTRNTERKNSALSIERLLELIKGYMDCGEKEKATKTLRYLMEHSEQHQKNYQACDTTSWPDYLQDAALFLREESGETP